MPAGRKKLLPDNVKQHFFSFAITPAQERDKQIVAKLEAMRNRNEFSAWIRDLIYQALQDKPQPVPQRRLGVGTITPVYVVSPNEPIQDAQESLEYVEPEPIP